MVEAAPTPSFKMSQPDLLLEFLIVAFDPPAQLGNVEQPRLSDSVKLLGPPASAAQYLQQVQRSVMRLGEGGLRRGYQRIGPQIEGDTSRTATTKSSP
jgi:hypothetical protein